MSDLSRPKRRPVNYGSADASNSSTVHTNASPSAPAAAPADVGSTSLASAAASVASPSPALSLSPNGHGQGATTPNIPPRSTSLTPELERMQRARTLTPQHHYQQIASILSSATPETVAKALDAQLPQQPQQQSMWEPSSIKQVPVAITATASNVTRPQSVIRKPVVGRATTLASAPAPQTVATTPERSDPSSASSILRRSVTAASPKTPASSRLDVAASSSHAADQATIPDSPASSLKASRDPSGQQAGAEPTTAMPILKRSATLREMQRNARGRLLQKSNGSKDAGEALQTDMPPVGNLAGSTLAATSLASSSFVPSATPTSPTEWQIRLLALQSEVETLRKEKQMLEAQFKQLGVNPVSTSAVPDAKAADQSTAETATSGSSTENPPAPLAIWKEIKSLTASIIERLEGQAQSLEAEKVPSTTRIALDVGRAGNQGVADAATPFAKRIEAVTAKDHKRPDEARNSPSPQSDVTAADQPTAKPQLPALSAPSNVVTGAADVAILIDTTAGGKDVTRKPAIKKPLSLTGSINNTINTSHTSIDNTSNTIPKKSSLASEAPPVPAKPSIVSPTMATQTKANSTKPAVQTLQMQTAPADQHGDQGIGPTSLSSSLAGKLASKVSLTSSSSSRTLTSDALPDSPQRATSKGSAISDAPYLSGSATDRPRPLASSTLASAVLSSSEPPTVPTAASAASISATHNPAQPPESVSSKAKLGADLDLGLDLQTDMLSIMDQFGF